MSIGPAALAHIEMQILSVAAVMARTSAMGVMKSKMRLPKPGS
jgi:hypothetical protein